VELSIETQKGVDFVKLGRDVTLEIEKVISGGNHGGFDSLIRRALK